MKTLILLRHGESQWNLENRFTGWTDVDLTERGRQEAAMAGELMLKTGLKPQIMFTSVLRRAIHTLQIAAAEMQLDWVPVIKDWHLNERHYGALQGLNKAETAERYGDDQVRMWRRGFSELPPLLTPDDSRYPGNDSRYASLASDEIPLSESLQDAIARVKSCWSELIVPAFRANDTILVVAHGNSLRGLVKMIRHLTATEIVDVEIPTGSPWVFELNDRMEPVSDYYLK